MDRTKNEVLYSATSEYLKDLDISNGIDSDLIEAELLDIIRQEFELENAVKPKNRQWPIPQVLTNYSIAEILLALYPIKLLHRGKAYDLIVYEYSGENEGIYISDNNAVDRIIRTWISLYNRTITERNGLEIINILRRHVPVCELTDNPDLIAVNNGIFDYKSKTLRPFTPDLAFTSKSKVNYNPVAINSVIHNNEDGTDWDVESWVESLSDDTEIIELIWQVIGAIIRPHVAWGKAICLYSERGNNGKGTLCALMRNLCGEGSHASIPFSNFGHDFLLQSLTHISAIITDENDVRGFIDKAANLKAVITNDTIQINRKFLEPITVEFKGIMVQCMNDYPKFADKTDSFYRRFTMIPFEKCFTGKERKYIKHDYLNRPEVLEYVLQKVLNTSYYELKVPAACELLLNEYKEYNDPIRQFLEEMLPECVWDLIPNQFLYDLYVAWLKKNSPSGKPQGKNSFVKDVKNTLISINSPEWRASKASEPTRNLMDKPEPLIVRYDLRDWMNANYKGNDINQICKPTLKSSYGGFLRA